MHGGGRRDNPANHAVGLSVLAIDPDTLARMLGQPKLLRLLHSLSGLRRLDRSLRSRPSLRTNTDRHRARSAPAFRLESLSAHSGRVGTGRARQSSLAPSKISRAWASVPPGEPFAFRVSARLSVSEGQPNCSKSDSAIAASRAFTSRLVPYFSVAKKISAKPPSSNRPTPAVYRMPACSKVISSCSRRLESRRRADPASVESMPPAPTFS